MGPQASKSYPGQRLVKPAGPQAERARQEIDYGRRDVAGYVFGALQPATGAAFTATYERRTTANWVDFLEQVERWIVPDAERVYAVVDNLNPTWTMPHMTSTAVVVMVPSWACCSGRPTRCGASRPCWPISRRTRRAEVRIPAWRKRAQILR